MPWVVAGDGLVRWSDRLSGLRWYVRTADNLMYFEIEREDEVSPAVLERIRALEGRTYTHPEWLAMNLWGPSSPQAQPEEQEDFQTAVTAGRARYERIIAAQSGPLRLAPNVQRARSEYFEGYYRTENRGPSGSGTEIASLYRYSLGNSYASGYIGEYRNYCDIEGGTITAEHNYAWDWGGELYYDPVRNAPVRLSNSEIFYQQWLAAGGGGRQLRSLVRSRVSGPGNGVIRVVRAALGISRGVEASFDLGTDGFYALLTAVNCTAAIWLVIDHGAELGITGIARIVITTNGSLRIDFS